jgi:hypothetical protein
MPGSRGATTAIQSGGGVGESLASKRFLQNGYALSAGCLSLTGGTRRSSSTLLGQSGPGIVSGNDKGNHQFHLVNGLALPNHRRRSVLPPPVGRASPRSGFKGTPRIQHSLRQALSVASPSSTGKCLSLMTDARTQTQHCSTS